MNSRDRPRGPPPGPLPHRGDMQSDTGSSPSTMTRGDAFEDEKKRIIHSLFAKKDEDGLRTYKNQFISFRSRPRTLVSVNGGVFGHTSRE